MNRKAGKIMIFNFDENFLTTSKSIFTATEIHQQPATWLKTLNQIKNEKTAIKAFIENVIKENDYDIILTGAGTSEFVGNSVYSYLNRLTGNYRIKSYATTDLVETPENFLDKNKKTLLISYGRSGNSPESIGAFDVANEVLKENVYHLFITCNKDGALSKAAINNKHAYAINLTPETHDQSFAMTSSYSNMYLATLLVFNLENLDQITETINTIAKNADVINNDSFKFITKIIEDYNFQRIVYLGANSLKGVAQESALKMLELTAGQITTMYDTPLGFRHGPKSIINDDTLTVVYLGDDEYQHKYELDLIKEMSIQRKGNKILALSNKKYDDFDDLVDYYFSFNSNKALDNVYIGLNYIMFAQLIALYKSLSLNITPDNPCPSGEVNRVVKGVTLYPYKSI